MEGRTSLHRDEAGTPLFRLLPFIRNTRSRVGWVIKRGNELGPIYIYPTGFLPDFKRPPDNTSIGQHKPEGPKTMTATQSINLAKIKTDQAPVEMPEGQPFVKNITNRKLLAAAWEAAGIPARYPLDTRSVFALLKIMGYAPTRNGFEYQVSRQSFLVPEKVGRNFHWTEREIVSFADCLEAQRNWLPCHRCHVHKMNADELAKGYKENAARYAAIDAFDRMPTLEVIGLLATCENPETRDLLAIALKRKLGLLDVKGDEAPNPENN